MKLSFQSNLKWTLAICFLVGFTALFLYRYNSQLWIQAANIYDILHHPNKLKDIISSFGSCAPLVYILIQMLQVVVAPIPGGPIEFLGGYLFGVKAGLLYSLIGLTLGSWLAFSLARIFKQWAIKHLVSPRILRKFDYLIGRKGTVLSFLLFLIPGFPKDALCYILGLTPMHLSSFLIMSTIGRTPGTLMATLQGAKAFDQQYVALLILSGMSAVVVLVFHIYHEEIHQMIRHLKWGEQKGGIS